MNHKLLTAIGVLVLILVSFVVIKRFFFSPPPAAPSATDESQKTLAVTAQNGKFTPDTFTTELFTTLNLSVSAVDQDYNFQVADYPRLDAKITKGQTTTIKIESLGVGEYPFTCNPGCTGKIVVDQQKDDESAEED